MKKWVESWLIPFVNSIAKTPGQKRVVYAALIVLGAVTAWFGFTVSQVSTEQLFVLGQTKMGEGRLK